MAERGFPRTPLENPWQEWDYSEVVPLPPEELYSGHPSAPGYRDPKPVRAGEATPGNGQPGIPMIQMGPGSPRGIINDFGYPMQPGMVYGDGSDDDSV